MEIYKDVIGYEGIYQVSSLGNIKSLKFNKEKYLKVYKNHKGYFIVCLTINNVKKSRRVHQLVAESFLNHKRCGMELVVNHIDFDRANNRVENLEIVTNRENCNLKHLKSSSIYTGVYWCKTYSKWRSNITVNGKLKHLGYFKDEIEASKAYQKELNNLIN